MLLLPSKHDCMVLCNYFTGILSVSHNLAGIFKLLDSNKKNKVFLFYTVFYLSNCQNLLNNVWDEDCFHT